MDDTDDFEDEDDDDDEERAELDTVWSFFYDELDRQEMLAHRQEREPL